MPLRASWMSLTLPLGWVRIALPDLVTWSLTPRGAGPWKAVGCPPAPAPPCGPAPAAPPARTPPPVVVVREPPVVVVREPVVVVVCAVRSGPMRGGCTGGCSVRCAGSARFCCGFGCRRRFRGRCLLIVCSRARDADCTEQTGKNNRYGAMPNCLAKKSHRHSCSSFLFQPARQLEVANAYSTLLTFPLVRVTFMSL